MSKYKISLYKCPTHIPFPFAVHTWFVISKDGKEDRYEVLFQKNIVNGVKTHFYKNSLPPNSGISIFPFLNNFLWKGTNLGSIEGEDNSTAEKMYNFISNSKENYPYLNKYFFLGPNSNTYTSFIIKNFPEFPFQLPWNAVGQNFID